MTSPTEGRECECVDYLDRTSFSAPCPIHDDLTDYEAEAEAAAAEWLAEVERQHRDAEASVGEEPF